MSTLVLVPAIPLATVLLSRLPLGRRFPSAVTLVAAGTDLALAVRLALRVVAAHEVVAIRDWVALDGFGATLLLLITFVATMAALFSGGYVATHEREPRRVRSYFMQFNLFIFALVLVPVLAEPALVWIAVEFTAVFSVLLVGFDRSQAALEAAWKYIALMFMGAAIALLGFFLLFWAQDLVGSGAPYSWSGLRAAAPAMPPTLTTAAFLLVLVGFGVKVGLVPMHTWLPDAHSQAPSPVCALLSGVKTTTALYVILRLGSLLPLAAMRAWMPAVGLLSVGVAAFLLLQVRDYKRLFAYSTVEHMGIMVTATGLGVTAGAHGAMLQMITHSLTKSFCFFAAGAALLAAGTREIAAVQGLIRTSPAAGAALLLGALAIGGAPPFAVFLSEFSIFRAGLVERQYVVTGLLVTFVTVAFFGILMHVNRMVFGRPVTPVGHVERRLPVTCLVTLVLAAIPVVALGVYEPSWVDALVRLAAADLLPGASP
ncbi:MAG TPA: proton-conducting transporter membrane subunit [Candidatus Binatia bacterium]|nr:proton-conducting transporter membrane subunit [Candidatus Binatia bacterium]